MTRCISAADLHRAKGSLSFLFLRISERWLDISARCGVAVNANALAKMRSDDVGARVAAALRSAAGKHVLFFGVGGGNDANSTMMVQLQLARDYSFAPGRISVLAMLPDLLLYRGFEPGPHLTCSSSRQARRGTI